MRGVLLALTLAAPAILPAQNPVVDSTRALLHAGSPEAARVFARAAAGAEPADPWAHHAVGLVALAQDSFDLAVGAAERAVRLAPQEARHHYLLGDAALEKAGKQGGLGALGSAKKDRQAMEQVLMLDPENLAARASPRHDRHVAGIRLDRPHR